MKVFFYIKDYIFSYKTRYFKFILYSFIFWIVTIVLPYISGNYIDILAGNHTRNIIYLYSFIILMVNILHLIISYLKDLTYTRLLNDVAFTLNMKIYNHLNKVPLYFFQSKDAVYLSRRINDDTNSLADFCISNPVLIFFNIFSILISLVILFVIDKTIPFILILAIPIYILLYIKFKDKLYKTNYLYKEKSNKYQAQITEQFINIKYIKTNVLFKETNNRLKAGYQEFINFVIRFFRFSYFFSNTNQIVLKAINAFVVCYGGLQVIEGYISIGKFSIISTYFSIIMSSVNYFTSLSSTYQQVLVSYDRLKEFETEPKEANGLIKLDNVTEISMERVQFSHYAENKILFSLTTVLKKGYIYCLKGANGAGKSSFINLMIGLYPDYDGKIEFNQINIKEIDRYYLRRNMIGVVEQEPCLVKGSILDNLVYGIDNVTFETIEYWCKRFDIYDMINNLPDKFDTLISENVSKLSGGEKQKISIIRILLKNVPILIFDEPTSALDFSSIDVFKQVICDIKQNKIIFIISHDKQVIEIADEIINL